MYGCVPKYPVYKIVQTKAAKYFLAVGKRTSNVSVRGDLELAECLTKQKLSCIRLKCKLVGTYDDRP
jgi:hypothetical protein